MALQTRPFREAIRMEFEFSAKKQHLYAELMGQLTGAQRLWVSLKMTNWEISRFRAEIAAANPQLTEEEVRLKWLEQVYGAELAAKVREDMKQKKSVDK
jgi:hypothetical protein